MLAVENLLVLKTHIETSHSMVDCRLNPAIRYVVVLFQSIDYLIFQYLSLSVSLIYLNCVT
jgi:hypothetical protein